ncbi:chitinase [Streptomyces sp. HNM0575]|uniref:chitinase n=1 Tax=Streptomyces sp. HNM0575 TaxID=2716338 RepID=UPI00145E12CF|nr:chitinase [Streptomyces sp. HNM0575]NLU71263.1 chitinase [Streptomyces sp. HNM0575]
MTNTPEAQPSRTSRRVKLAAAAAAAVTVAGAAFAFAGNASAGEEHHGSTAKAGGGFAPYVDTSLEPSFDLLKSSEKTGVKEFNLAFINSAGECTPKWGSGQDLGENAVAKQIEDFRAKGGDVRVSFGGANGQELALACTSADQLAEAYGKVVEAFALKKVDFDIEGATLPNTEANTRRAQAIAKLQQKHKDLDVSFTLPVLPEGLTQDGTNLLENAKKNNVKVSAVNIMAMDYGPKYDGDMGKYAIDAATATQKQVKSSLGIDDDAKAWSTVAVTPMIGVNDVNVEIFKPDDAAEVKKFADEKKLSWLSMWSATRDKACPGGTKDQADPTCSSIEQGADAFTKGFTG